jgi:hypothetical protein
MPQSVDLPFAQGMDFGMGVNLVEGGIPGKAVDTGPITTPTGATGLTVSYNMQLISSVEDLYDSIGVSVSAGGRYGLFNAQGKVQYAKEAKFNSQSTFLLARCFVEKVFEQCEDARLKPDAADLLRRGDAKGFQERFGDGFVRGMLKGGEFHVVIAMASLSKTQQEELAASLQAKYGGLFAEAEIDVKVDDKTREQMSRTELKVSTFQRGGTGPETSFTKDIEGVMARLQRFPAIVEANPVSYGVQVASYRTLDLPDGPSPIAIEAQSDRLSEYAQAQVRLQSLRNDVEFMQLHRNFYKDPPPLDRLNAWQEHFGTQLDKVTAQAVACSRDPEGGCPAFSLQMPEDFTRPERTPGIAGLWEMVIFGQGESRWTLSPLEDNKFEATEEGLGNAKGTAVLTGRTVQLDWTATNPGDTTTGRFMWTLDESFSSADATVQFFSVHTELGILPGRFTKIG